MCHWIDEACHYRFPCQIFHYDGRSDDTPHAWISHILFGIAHYLLFYLIFVLQDCRTPRAWISHNLSVIAHHLFFCLIFVLQCCHSPRAWISHIPSEFAQHRFFCLIFVLRSCRTAALHYQTPCEDVCDV